MASNNADAFYGVVASLVSPQTNPHMCVIPTHPHICVKYMCKKGDKNITMKLKSVTAAPVFEVTLEWKIQQGFTHGLTLVQLLTSPSAAGYYYQYLLMLEKQSGNVQRMNTSITFRYPTYQ